MTKDIRFDLEFSISGVHAISARGAKFMQEEEWEDLKPLYNKAIEQNLHVRFDDVKTRDELIGEQNADQE